MLTLTTPDGLTLTAETDVQLADKWGQQQHGPEWNQLPPFDEHTAMYAILDDLAEIREGTHPGYTLTESETAMTTHRALRIPALTLATTVELPSTETWLAIQQTLDVRSFDVVGCRDGIDLYVDDEGAINGSPFNLPLTVLAHILGVPAALFGDALALSNDDEGNTRGLSDEQLQIITNAMQQGPTPDVVDSIVATLNVHPMFDPIIAMLRAG